MRAQAHLRYNCLVRLRQVYQEAVSQTQQDQRTFPVQFSYEKGPERWHFRLWDRRSFVLAYAERYSRQTVTNAQEKLRGFTDERNTPFVEFVKATRQADDTTPSGPWFTDLLKLGLLGDGPVSGTDEEVKAKQEWLRQWGYADPERGYTQPFLTTSSGLLCWSHDAGMRRSWLVRKIVLMAFLCPWNRCMLLLPLVSWPSICLRQPACASMN